MACAPCPANEELDRERSRIEESASNIKAARSAYMDLIYHLDDLGEPSTGTIAEYGHLIADSRRGWESGHELIRTCEVRRVDGIVAALDAAVPARLERGASVVRQAPPPSRCSSLRGDGVDPTAAGLETASPHYWAIYGRSLPQEDLGTDRSNPAPPGPQISRQATGNGAATSDRDDELPALAARGKRLRLALTRQRPKGYDFP